MLRSFMLAASVATSLAWGRPEIRGESADNSNTIHDHKKVDRGGLPHANDVATEAANIKAVQRCNCPGGLLLGRCERYVGPLGIRRGLWPVNSSIVQLHQRASNGRTDQCSKRNHTENHTHSHSNLIAGTLTLIAARVAKVGTGITRI
jgi:hypothetical protein